MANVLAVNVAHSRPNPDERPVVVDRPLTQRPTDGPIAVRAPGPMHGGAGSGPRGGLSLATRRCTAATYQAVYAYAREDLDVWQRELARDLRQRNVRREHHPRRGST